MAESHQNCFVLMPFGSSFDDYYQHVYAVAIRDAGLTPVRADDIMRPGAITQQIWGAIQRAAVCVADLTRLNPNVMYELGLAHALEKPVVQTVQDIQMLPFDLRHLRTLVYDTQSVNWQTSLRSDLTQMLQSCLTDPQNSTAFYRPSQAAPQQSESGQAASLPLPQWAGISLNANIGTGWLTLLVSGRPDANIVRGSSYKEQVIDSIMARFKLGETDASNVEINPYETGLYIALRSMEGEQGFAFRMEHDQPHNVAYMMTQMRAPASTESQISVDWLIKSLYQMCKATLTIGIEYKWFELSLENAVAVAVALSNWPSGGIVTSGVLGGRKMGNQSRRGYSLQKWYQEKWFPMNRLELVRRFVTAVLQDDGYVGFEDSLAAVTHEAPERFTG